MNTRSDNSQVWDAFDVEPTNIGQLISPHTALIQALLASYWEQRSQGGKTPWGPMLLYGRSQMGKGLLSRILYRELALENWRLILGEDVKRESDLLDPLRFVGGDSMLVVRCDNSVPTLLCQRMLEELMLGRTMPVHYLSSEKLDLSNLVLIVIAEHPLLSKSLLNMFKLILKFDPSDYVKEDRLFRIIDQRLGWLGWQINEKGRKTLAHYSNGYPGGVVRILTLARYFAVQDGKAEINCNHVKDAWHHVTHNWGLIYRPKGQPPE